TDLQQLLNTYAVFLESILNRNVFKTLLSIEYYEIRQNSAGTRSCCLLPMNAPPAVKGLAVRVSGEAVDGSLSYTIHCDKQVFSSQDYGNQLFQAVREYFLQFCRSEPDYPVYITDIDLPFSAFRIQSPEQLQTIHYL